MREAVGDEDGEWEDVCCGVKEVGAGEAKLPLLPEGFFESFLGLR